MNPQAHSDLDYLQFIVTESGRFAQVMDIAPADAKVPTCPDWTSDDLLWHLGEVQWFWGTIVRDGISGEQAEALKPERPADRASLRAFFAEASRNLSEALAAQEPDTAAWTWSSDQTVGFICRRQAHEALIHRLDAELTAGERTPMDRLLSADGVDEGLRVMYGNLPDWATFTPDEAKTVRFVATDTGDSWFVTLGRFTGTGPDGTSYDEPDLHATRTDPGGEAAAAIKGSASDLDCWLWHRPTLGPIDRSGDEEVLAAFDATIAPGID